MRDGLCRPPFFAIGNSFNTCHEELAAKPHMEFLKGQSLVRLLFVTRMRKLEM